MSSVKEKKSRMAFTITCVPAPLDPIDYGINVCIMMPIKSMIVSVCVDSEVREGCPCIHSIN